MKPKILKVCDLIETNADFLLIFSTEVKKGIVEDTFKADILMKNAITAVKQVYNFEYSELKEMSYEKVKEFLSDLVHSIKFSNDVVNEFEENYSLKNEVKIQELIEGCIGALNRVVIGEAIHDKAQWSFILKLKNATENINKERICRNN